MDADDSLALGLERAIELTNAITPPISRRLIRLRERLLNERLQLAVLGQFKRGKSTLVNALLGAPVLPAGVVPLTSIPTFIAWGETPRILVTYGAQRPQSEFSPETSVQDELGAAATSFFTRAFEASLEKCGRLIETTLAARMRDVDDVVDEVRKKSADLFEVAFVPSSGSERLTLRCAPYWVARPGHETILSMPSSLFSRILPRALREARRRRQQKESLATLVQRNVENLRWAMLQGIDETFRRFEVAVTERIASAIEATQGAVDAASTLRAARAGQISAEFDRLHHALENLRTIRSAIAGPAPETKAQPKGMSDS